MYYWIKIIVIQIKLDVTYTDSFAEFLTRMADQL